MQFATFSEGRFPAAPQGQTKMTTLEEKKARLKTADDKIQEFKNRGGDIDSPEAASLQEERTLAANDLGYKTPDDDGPKFIKDFEG